MEDKTIETSKKKILDAIKHGQIKMRPRWHFVLQAALVATGVFIVFLILIYLASFILFVLRNTGVLFIPAFGSRGWFAFFRSLPWVLILFALIFILILEVLVRRYSFAYRQPLMYSAISIIILVLIGGIFMAPLHKNFYRSLRDRRFPLAADFYERFEGSGFDDIHKGVISALSPNGFIINDPIRGNIAVIIASSTRLPYGDGFSEGDTVVVFGDERSSFVQAYGVQRVSE